VNEKARKQLRVVWEEVPDFDHTIAVYGPDGDEWWRAMVVDNPIAECNEFKAFLEKVQELGKRPRTGCT